MTFPVVGIGASAGGLAAIKILLEGLPARPDMAFVVILHLSPSHESNAAAILQTSTPMRVLQIGGPTKIERDHVYVIPPTYDLVMTDGHLQLSESTRTRGRHIVIDHFFRTLADAHRERAIGIVLSGTGSDGAAGIARLKEHGGIVIAQTPADAEYDGMPSSAIATGKVDIVLPTPDIADKLVALWRNARRIEIPGGDAVAAGLQDPASPEAAEDALRQVMKILHARTGHDFKNYKRATVLRRIERRLQVNALPDLPSYRAHLDADPGEAKGLLDDMLIGVTQFFRDRDAFEALERDVLPRLCGEAPVGEAVRVWVPACSTGEEAYSIAMLLDEQVERQGRDRKFTVFASDIDEHAILLARAGTYHEAVALDVAPPRLHRFFGQQAEGSYRIHKSLRENVIFAVHNLLHDPPFSRLDLVSCRNLLIYLDRAAQRAVLEIFHFALRPGGTLFLGSSESIDAAARLFSPVDKGMRIYRANPVGRPLRPPQGPPSLRPAAVTPKGGRASAPDPPAANAADVHRRLLEDIAPPSILVTADHEVLHVAAGAARFLRHPAGEPSHNLLQVVVAELQSELRTALFQVQQTRAPVEVAPVTARLGGQDQRVRVTVRPARHPSWPGEMLLVAFDAQDVTADAEGVPAPGAGDPLIARLEAELQRKSDQLRTTIEQYEASSEELKSSNEELQAINEELRSATEELETSKEELQSTNEELVTVNHELKTKIDETTGINDDLKNLITSSDVATVFVDPDMRIKRYTPAAAAIFNLIVADVGRPLFDITHRLEYAGLADDARAVFASLRTIEREVVSADGRRLLARLLPYRTTENRIGGAVLTFVDVTSLRAAEAEAHASAERMALIAQTMTDFAILALDSEGHLTSWSAGAVGLFGYAAAEAIGQRFDMLFTEEDREAGVPQRELAMAEAQGVAPDDRWMRRKDGSTFFASGITKPLTGNVRGYAKICRDMTSMRRAEEMTRHELEYAQQGEAQAAADNQLKDEFLAVMSHELKHPLNLIAINAQLLASVPELHSLPAAMRAARTIQRTVEGQARIIDDLLDMSRTNTGKLSLNRVPVLLGAAIQPCLNWALTEARGKRIRLFAEGVDEAIVVDGDPVRIEQIVWNLLSNALKFSPEGSTVRLRVAVDGNDALLEVKDGGCGIAPEFLPHMFRMFRQADPTTTRIQGGLGIGLALVKSLVDLHGGSIEAESDGVGKGATFRVRLPLHQSTGFADLQIAAAGGARRPLAGARVLLVDDTADTLETFAYLLQNEGAEVSCAQSAAAALQLVDDNDFDLIISDIGMPRMDGYHLLAEVRRRPRGRAVPAIALTGHGRPEDVRHALDAGFQAHVDKPVRFESMLGVMEAVLGGAPIAEARAEPDRKE